MSSAVLVRSDDMTVKSILDYVPYLLVCSFIPWLFTHGKLVYMSNTLSSFKLSAEVSFK